MLNSRLGEGDALGRVGLNNNHLPRNTREYLPLEPHRIGTISSLPSPHFTPCLVPSESEHFPHLSVRWEFMFHSLFNLLAERVSRLVSSRRDPVSSNQWTISKEERGRTVGTMEHCDLVTEMSQVERLSTQDRLYLARM